MHLVDVLVGREQKPISLNKKDLSSLPTDYVLLSRPSLSCSSTNYSTYYRFTVYSSTYFVEKAAAHIDKSAHIVYRFFVGPTTDSIQTIRAVHLM